MIGKRELTDRELREWLIESPREGWRAFVDQFTPELLAAIEYGGIREHDEAMEIYVRVCERLSANDCDKLRRHDPARGALRGWLTVVVRHVIVDWVRSRKGRRRLFKSIEALEAFDRRVFELYYWRGYNASEAAELAGGADKGVSDVFAALDRIERALSARQRIELLVMATRGRPAMPLEADDGRLTVDVADDRPDPERQLRAADTGSALSNALAQLPPEDALIVSMRFIDGLSPAEVGRALHIAAPTPDRIGGILGRLRELLMTQGVDRTDVPSVLAADGKGSLT